MKILDSLHLEGNLEGSNSTAGVPTPVYSQYPIQSDSYSPDSGTTFTFPGDVTVDLAAGKFIRIDAFNWGNSTNFYGVIASSNYIAPTTYITLVAPLNFWYYGPANLYFGIDTGVTESVYPSIAMFGGQTGGIDSVAIGPNAKAALPSYNYSTTIQSSNGSFLSPNSLQFGGNYTQTFFPNTLSYIECLPSTGFSSTNKLLSISYDSLNDITTFNYENEIFGQYYGIGSFIFHQISSAAVATGAFAFGDGAIASKNKSFAFGANSQADYENSFAFGTGAATTASYQVAIRAYNGIYLQGELYAWTNIVTPVPVKYLLHWDNTNNKVEAVSASDILGLGSVLTASDTAVGKNINLYDGQFRFYEQSTGNAIGKLYQDSTYGGGLFVSTSDQTKNAGYYPNRIIFQNATTGTTSTLDITSSAGNFSYTLPSSSGEIAVKEQVWGLSGNSGTTAGTNYIGTSDNNPVAIKANNNLTAIIVNDVSDFTPSMLLGNDTNLGLYLNNSSAKTFIDGSSSGLVTLNQNNQVVTTRSGSGSLGFRLNRSNGSFDNPTGILNGWQLGDLSWGSYTSSSISNRSARIIVTAVGDHIGGTNGAAKFAIEHTRSGWGSATESFRLLGDNAGIGFNSSPIVTWEVGKYTAANALPAVSGTTQSAGHIHRLSSNGNNTTLDFGTDPLQSWVQSTDRTNLAVSRNLLLNPNNGLVGVNQSSPIGQLHVTNPTFATMATFERLGAGSINISAGTTRFIYNTEGTPITAYTGTGIPGTGALSVGFNFGVKSTTDALKYFGAISVGVKNYATGTGIMNFTLNGSGNTTPQATLSSSGLGIGLGAVEATEKLQVAGNVRFSGALMPNNLSGTTGQILTSAGAGVAPTWANNTPPISSLTAAVATNTIDNTNFAQTWNWNTLTTQNGLTLNSTSLTTGNILNLTNSNAAATGKVLRVTNSSTTSADAIYVTSSATAGSALNLNSAVTTGNGMFLNTTALTTGNAVAIVNSNVATTGTTLSISDSSTAGTGLRITSSATTGNAQSITANSLTTGSALDISVTNTALNSTNGAFRVINNSAPVTATGLFARIQPNSTAGSGVTILNDGKLGVSITSPLTTAHVNGSFSTKAVRVSTAAYTVLANDSTIHFVTGASGIITIPAAATFPGRIIIFANDSGVNLNTSIAYRNNSGGGGTTTTVNNNIRVGIQSDGTEWFQINQ